MGIKFLKGLERENERGYRVKPKHFRSWSWDIDIKLCQIYVHILLYKNRRVKQIIFSKYSIKVKTTISQRRMKNLGLLLLLFEFNNFSSIIDIIDNIVYTSVSRDQNSRQWQCSILITWYRRRRVIMILHCQILVRNPLTFLIILISRKETKFEEPYFKKDLENYVLCNIACIHDNSFGFQFVSVGHWVMWILVFIIITHIRNIIKAHFMSIYV